MTHTQKIITIFGAIFLLNLIITVLYKKYDSLKQLKKGRLDISNRSVFTNITPGSFMPRVPFLIIHRSKDSSLRNIIITHNILCVTVYCLFITLFMID